MLNFLMRMAMAGTVLLAPFHAGIVVLYSLARLSGQIEYWVVDALSYVLPLLLMLSILHLPGAILRRSPFLLTATAIPLVVFGILYGPRYLPRWEPEEVGSSFTVMSYNVWAGNQEYDQIVATITETSPDVVGLQELTDQIANEIQDDLADEYPYREIDDGQALFSRYPIVSHEVLRIGDVRIPIPVQHIELDVNGRRIGIINAHTHTPNLIAARIFGLRLAYPIGLRNYWRDLETRELMEAIETMEGPLVVLGDFNLTDLQAVYKEMTAVLVDAHTEAGYGLGLTRTPFRGVGPATWRIDFVFHTPDLVALGTDVGAFGGSDHRSVVAELAFRDG